MFKVLLALWLPPQLKCNSIINSCSLHMHLLTHWSLYVTSNNISPTTRSSCILSFLCCPPRWTYWSCVSIRGLQPLANYIIVLWQDLAHTPHLSFMASCIPRSFACCLLLAIRQIIGDASSETASSEGSGLWIGTQLENCEAAWFC